MEDIAPVQETLQETIVETKVETAVMAEKIRTFTGLSIFHIASIFSVSRMAYYNWLHGGNVTALHTEKLFYTLTAVEEAHLLFGKNMKLWLLSEIETTRPIDLLKQNNFTRFNSLARESYFKNILTTLYI